MSITNIIFDLQNQLDSDKAKEFHDKINKIAIELKNNLDKVENSDPVGIKEELPQLDIDFISLCYHREEQGDADMLHRLYNGRIVYDNTEKDWYWWGGQHWVKNKNLMIYLYSAQISEQYLRAATTLRKEYEETSAIFSKRNDNEDAPSQDEIDRNDKKLSLANNFIKRSKSLRRIGRTKNALEYMKGVMGVEGEVWDTHNLKLGVSNGIIDLTTGKLSHGKPDDYIKTVANIDYDESAECPRFEQFILEIFGGDVEIAGFIKRLLGYSITGLTTEHIFPIFWGEDGRNGKSTLLNILQDVLSPLMKPIHSDVIIDTGRKGGPNPFLMELKGLRMGYVSETEKQAKLKEATIKSITGGDTITARRLHENATEWKPTHQLILVTNPKPIIDCLDNALWERIILIPFVYRFVEEPDNSNRFEQKRDTKLIEKLQAEKSGILNWLLSGYLEWQKDGLQIPEQVKAATNIYQQEADNFPDFIEENCVINPDSLTPVTDMFFRYESYCSDNPHKMDRMKFTKRMEKMGFNRKVKRFTTNSKKCWFGIGLLSN